MLTNFKRRLAAIMTVTAILFGGMVMTAPAASAASITCPANATYGNYGKGGSVPHNQKFTKYVLEKLCTSTPNWYEKNVLRKSSYKLWMPTGIYKYKIYNNKTGKFIKDVVTKDNIPAAWYTKAMYPFR